MWEVLKFLWEALLPKLGIRLHAWVDKHKQIKYQDVHCFSEMRWNINPNFKIKLSEIMLNRKKKKNCTRLPHRHHVHYGHLLRLSRKNSLLMLKEWSRNNVKTSVWFHSSLLDYYFSNVTPVSVLVKMLLLMKLFYIIKLFLDFTHHQQRQ